MPSPRIVNILVMALMLCLSGCAGQETRDLVAKTIVQVPKSTIADQHEIFVATTRERAEKPAEVFDGRRSPTTSYARLDMSVPAIHKIGAIERRASLQPADPSKYFVAQSVTGYRDQAAFEAALRKDIASKNGRALVFVHGYNTAFDAAAYRMTQIVHDADYQGTPVLFTWASGGRAFDYVYDSNSASAARDSLETTLRLLAKVGATRIDIIAHSMGTWVTMEALRQLAITGDRDLHGHLGDVVLASPDIDVDVFKTQMMRYGKPDKPFILFLSDDDRALRISSYIAGNRPRLGDYRQATEIAALGVTVVDLSNVKALDSLGHTKFADNPLLIKILGDRLKQNGNLDMNERQITDRVNSIASGLGGAVTSAAEIIITTPLNVLRIGVGQ